MIKRIGQLGTVVGIALMSSGCAQLGFMSGGFFDAGGPTVLESCSAQAPQGAGATKETFVRPANCETLDQAKASYAGGDLLGAEDKFRASIEAFTLDASRRTDLRTAWFGLAAVYDDLRRFADADKAYSTIKTSFGEDFRYHNNYGYSLYLRGNFSEAEKEYRAALVLRPDDERVLSNLDLVTGAMARGPAPGNDTNSVSPLMTNAPDMMQGTAPMGGNQ